MEQLVIEAISNILAQNKVPTVALTKATLNKSVPMPVIISVISRYKNNPAGFTNTYSNTVPLKNNQEKDNSQLDRIETKLDQLLNLLQPGSK
jgi:hypothetical protein